MIPKVGILCLEASGNVGSIANALKRIGAQPIMVRHPAEIERVDAFIFPGVGTFHQAMCDMKAKNLIEPVSEAIRTKPTLGICLGMQLLARIGFEQGQMEGLFFFDGEVKPMVCDAPIPHMGFNAIEVQDESSLLAGLNGADFYFMHSYEFVAYQNILSLTTYAGHKFVSAIGNGQTFGVQFHPEKSRDSGIEVFRNFLNEWKG